MKFMEVFIDRLESFFTDSIDELIIDDCERVPLRRRVYIQPSKSLYRQTMTVNESFYVTLVKSLEMIVKKSLYTAVKDSL